MGRWLANTDLVVVWSPWEFQNPFRWYILVMKLGIKQFLSFFSFHNVVFYVSHSPRKSFSLSPLFLFIGKRLTCYSYLFFSWMLCCFFPKFWFSNVSAFAMEPSQNHNIYILQNQQPQLGVVSNSVRVSLYTWIDSYLIIFHH